MKKTLALLTLVSTTVVLLSVTAFAQASAVQQGMGTFAEIINTFNKTVVRALGTLFMSGAVVAFFFGLTKFIWGLRAGDPKVISNGRQFMIWALTALFVMFSVYGIVNFFRGALNLNDNTITIPEINYGNGSGSGSGASGAASGAQGGTLCPNGIGRYYNASDYNIICNNSGGAASGAQQASLKANGAQCNFPTECSSGYCQNGPYGSQCAANPSGGTPSCTTVDEFGQTVPC